jgi:Flp pilus assembly pilin Flp
VLSWLRSFRNDEQGQGLVEYTLLLAFVLFVVVGLASGYHSSVAGITSVSNSQLLAANTNVQ